MRPSAPNGSLKARKAAASRLRAEAVGRFAYSLTLPALLLGAWAAPGIEPGQVAPYVFKVTCAGSLGIGGASTTLTGFQLDGVLGIVTCLHGVLKCKRISAQNEVHQLYDLSLGVVDVDKDLALLVSTKDWPLRGGLVTGTVPPDGSSLEVWGYPWDAQTLQPTRTLAVRKQSERLEFLLGSGPEVPRWRLRSSPVVSTPMISIEGHIERGHSGAPVLRSAGYVVGVANGGRDDGRGEFVWAVPLVLGDIASWRVLRSADEARLLEQPIDAGLLGKSIETALEIAGTSLQDDFARVVLAESSGFPLAKIWDAYRRLLATYRPGSDGTRMLELAHVAKKVEYLRIVSNGQAFRDLASGLHWSRDLGSMSYGEANTQCGQLLEAGRKWRLPTKKELISTRFEGKVHPAFGIPNPKRLWSAEAVPNAPSKVFVMHGSAFSVASIEGSTVSADLEKAPVHTICVSGELAHW